VAKELQAPSLRAQEITVTLPLQLLVFKARLLADEWRKSLELGIDRPDSRANPWNCGLRRAAAPTTAIAN
jgi:hypothetical protein